jgi:hypothetical protein
MNTTTKTRTRQIDEKTYLGIGMLIAESAAGYQPIAAVSTIREAKEIAAFHKGQHGPAISYKVWAQSHDGSYTVIHEIVNPA